MNIIRTWCSPSSRTGQRPVPSYCLCLKATQRDGEAVCADRNGRFGASLGLPEIFRLPHRDKIQVGNRPLATASSFFHQDTRWSDRASSKNAHAYEVPQLWHLLCPWERSSRHRYPFQSPSSGTVFIWFCSWGRDLGLTSYFNSCIWEKQLERFHY